MTPFQDIVRLKIERRKAAPARQDEIDQAIKNLALQLSHEEAVYIVRKYEIK